MTPQQSTAYDFIRTYCKAEGCSPTLQEIATACARKSRSGAHRIVTSLEKQGKVIRFPYTARSVRPVENCPHCGGKL